MGKKTKKNAKKNTGKSFVKCAKCNSDIEKKRWLVHNKNLHYNLSWIDGEPEIDLKNEKLVTSILLPFYKKITFKCEICENKFKSPGGFYSHINSCGKEQDDPATFKVQCELCNKWLLPVSMKAHMGGVHRPKDTVIPMPIPLPIDEEPEVISKRKSAMRAISLIEDITKEFGEDEVTQVGSQTSEATPKIKKNQFKINRLDLLTEFVCRKCEFKCNTKPEIIEHVFQEHNNPLEMDNEFVVSDDDDDDDDSEYEMDSQYDLDENISDVDDEIISGEDDAEPDRHSKDEISQDFYKLPSLYSIHLSVCKDISRDLYQLNMKFINCNHSNKLYEDIEDTEMKFLNDCVDIRRKYLPPFLESVRVSFRKYVMTNVSDIQWKRMHLFQSSFDNDVLSIFCGGPIWAGAWLPIPHILENEDQFLAVASLKDVNYSKFYEKNSCVDVDCSIQLWNFGKLNKQTKMTEVEPKLEAILAHHLGEIFQMEWCPSGCYDPNKRMGLLAVASVTGSIQIFNVPFVRNDGDDLNIIQVKPCYKLVYEPENYPFHFPTRLAWSKTLGHKLIAGGYSSGMVCIWNVSTKSKLLKTFNQTEQVYEISPIRSIPAHVQLITGIGFSSINDDTLFTCSQDGYLKFWDLITCTVINSAVKERFTTAIWPSNYLTVITGSETIMDVVSGSALYSLRDFNFKQITFGKVLTNTWSLSHNDWSVYTLAGYVEGLVSINHTAPLFLPIKVSLPKRKLNRFLSACIPVNLNKTGNPSSSSHTYDETNSDFGIVFDDLLPKDLQDQEKYRTLNDKRTLLQNYPIQSANFVAWNPNKNSSNFYVTGYQSGFLRLSKIKLNVKLF